FCALCVDPCPVDCIFMGSTYDQSCFSRDGCIVDFAKLPLEVAWGQASLNPTAVAASKLVAEPVWTKPPDPPAPEKKPAPAKAERAVLPGNQEALHGRLGMFPLSCRFSPQCCGAPASFPWKGVEP